MIARWNVIERELRARLNVIGYLQLYQAGVRPEQLDKFPLTVGKVREWLARSDPVTTLQSDTVGLNEINTTLGQPIDPGGGALMPPTPPAATAAVAELDTGEVRDDDDATKFYDPTQIVHAVRTWLFTTCWYNTPARSVATFTLHFFAPKGAQRVWQLTVDYDARGEAVDKPADDVFSLPEFPAPEPVDEEDGEDAVEFESLDDDADDADEVGADGTAVSDNEGSDETVSGNKDAATRRRGAGGGKRRPDHGQDAVRALRRMGQQRPITPQDLAAGGGRVTSETARSSMIADMLAHHRFVIASAQQLMALSINTTRANAAALADIVAIQRGLVQDANVGAKEARHLANSTIGTLAAVQLDRAEQEAAARLSGQVAQQSGDVKRTAVEQVFRTLQLVLAQRSKGAAPAALPEPTPGGSPSGPPEGGGGLRPRTSTPQAALPPPNAPAAPLEAVGGITEDVAQYLVENPRVVEALKRGSVQASLANPEMVDLLVEAAEAQEAAGLDNIDDDVNNQIEGENAPNMGQMAPTEE